MYTYGHWLLCRIETFGDKSDMRHALTAFVGIGKHFKLTVSGWDGGFGLALHICRKGSDLRLRMG